MPTTLDLTQEQIEHYRAAAQRRYERERLEIQRHQALAWEAARRAAQVLKTEFKATRVVAFGSLVHDGRFTRWSDVDIAAWGIAPEDTFQAIGVISEEDFGVSVNLVDVNTATSSLLAIIERDGIEL